MLQFKPLDSELQDKVILVTGASKGIGSAVAMSFAMHGAEVILCSRSSDKLSILSDKIEQSGGTKPSILPVDLESSSPADFAEIRRIIDRNYAKLDGILHNAGILGLLSPLEHYPIEQWYRCLQVNLNSSFLLTQSLLPLVKRSNSGSIIFTSSKLGRSPKANWGAYAIASSGIITLMQLFASELSNYSIKVNAVVPDRVATELRQSVYPMEEPSELIQPVSLVDYYLYLMSPRIAITGQTLQLSANELAIVD